MPFSAGDFKTKQRSRGIRVSALQTEKEKGRPASRPFLSFDLSQFLVAAVLAEVKEIEQVTKRRRVNRNVGVIPVRYRVREIVPAAVRDGRQIPVALDEFNHRHVIRVFMRDVSWLQIGGHHEEDNPRAVAEEVQRLYVTGVVIAAAFVLGDEDGGVFRVRRGLQLV